MSSAATAVIDLNALQHNLERARDKAPHARLMAIIKANGYGHGLDRVARALHEADALGVASLAEGIALRESGIQQTVLLLEGVSDASELALAASHQLALMVHHPSQIELLEKISQTDAVDVWLKIDTGMHRLGIQPEAFPDAWQRLQACASVASPARLLTHLACADERDNDMTPSQLGLFADTIKGCESECSAANSAGVLGWPDSHYDWVRPGIMLYGVSPFTDDTGRDHDLQPVMTLRTRLIAINQFRKGDTIGYGASWQCPEDMPVGVAAIGYGDGYPRHAQAGTPVLVNGQRAPLVGRVSMDMICIDLRDVSAADIGDEVEVWGEQLPVEEVARCADTIAYELLCGITSRVNIVEKD
jgi:alanine racemase